MRWGRQIDSRSGLIDMASFMSHLWIITSLHGLRKQQVPKVFWQALEMCPPPLSLPHTFLETEVSCQLIVDLSRTITKLLSCSLSNWKSLFPDASIINSSLCQIPNTHTHTSLWDRERVLFIATLAVLQRGHSSYSSSSPPKFTLHLCPAGTKKVVPLRIRLFSVFLVPKIELNFPRGPPWFFLCAFRLKIELLLLLCST